MDRRLMDSGVPRARVVIATRATRQVAANVLRDAGDLILTRGHERVPSCDWPWDRDGWEPKPGCALDIANAMSLARFGVYAKGLWGGKHWRLQDQAYGIAYHRLFTHLMREHRSNVCGWNEVVPRARDVVATLWAVGDRVIDRHVDVPARVRVHVAELDRMVADGSCPYPLTEPALDAAPVVVPDVVPAEWVARS